MQYDGRVIDLPASYLAGPDDVKAPEYLYADSVYDLTPLLQTSFDSNGNIVPLCNVSVHILNMVYIHVT